MSILFENELGTVEISEEVIQSLAGAAATECYGVVGMASKQFFRDGIAELLKQENYQRGIIVREEDKVIHIDMYVIVSFGVRISEVVHEIQKKVKYDIEAALNIQLGSVNVFVQDVQRKD